MFIHKIIKRYSTIQKNPKIYIDPGGPGGHPKMKNS